MVYKYADRTEGNDYTVVDLKNIFVIKNFNLSFMVNNVFDTQYSETNLVPMPGRTYLFSFGYNR